MHHLRAVIHLYFLIQFEIGAPMAKMRNLDIFIKEIFFIARINVKNLGIFYKRFTVLHLVV